MVVRCPSCGFRFPVNPQKHVDRKEKYCPRCHTPVQVRSRLSFKPNQSWTEMRNEKRLQALRKQAQKQAKSPAQFFFKGGRPR